MKNYPYSIIIIIFSILISFNFNTLAHYDCEPDLLEVLFHPDYSVRLSGETIVSQTNKSVTGINQLMKTFRWIRWERLNSNVTVETLDMMHLKAEEQLKQPVYNLNNIFYLNVLGEWDIWEIAEKLKELPEVINAYPVPKPMPLPVPTPNWQDNQEYLNNEPAWPPTGMNVYKAWEDVGGDGTGVTICDLEYSWNSQHVDLTKALNGQKNPHAVDPYSDTDHGTAVLGEMIADDNGWGVTGICPGADIILYGTYYDPNPPHTNPDWRLPGAMVEAMTYLSAGDVMLLEQQWEYSLNQKNFIPVEWWGSFSPSSQTFNSVYASIVTAIGNGIHVVEAGGNGGVDLDTLTWYGDSGAIIVGAGGAYSGGYYPEGDLAPLNFSCYGTRVNVQGWGEEVTTTGYGTYTGSTGLNDMFCWDFAGTSSASPMIAGSIACCVGYWTQSYLQSASTLTPVIMRSILMQTGTPQDPFTTRNIGPRPDLEEAFKAIDTRAPAFFYEVDLQLSSTFFTAGDPFSLSAFINNPGPNAGTTPFVILLEVQGTFWFYPSWSTSFDYHDYTLNHGVFAIDVIPAFNWPSGTGKMNDIRFYGALLTKDMSAIWGIYDVETFGFDS